MAMEYMVQQNADDADGDASPASTIINQSESSRQDQQHGSTLSALERLPDELLLEIVSHFLGCRATLHCLRKVSTTFRRLSLEPKLWNTICTRRLALPWYPARDPCSVKESDDPWHLPSNIRKDLEHRLRRDGLCKACIRVAERSRSLDLKLGLESLVVKLEPDSDMCRFKHKSDRFQREGLVGAAAVYCTGCRKEHHIRAFGQLSYTHNHRALQGVLPGLGTARGGTRHRGRFSGITANTNTVNLDPRLPLSYESRCGTTHHHPSSWHTSTTANLNSNPGGVRGANGIGTVIHELQQLSLPLSRNGGVCLGRQGAVQLCEHVHIPWATVEACFGAKAWGQGQPASGSDGNKKSERNDEGIVVAECRHPSHDIHRCALALPKKDDDDVDDRKTQADAETSMSTWPTARIVVGGGRKKHLRSDWIYLRLEWTPHSRIPTGTTTAMTEDELHCVFHSYRNSGPTAACLVPAYPGAVHLPEMVCFGSMFRGRTTNKDNKVQDPVSLDQESSPVLPPAPADNNHHRLLGKEFIRSECNQQKAHRVYHVMHHHGEEQEPTKEPTASSSRCLATHYIREIMVGKVEGIERGPFNPTHAWFHAMDPDTYPRRFSSHTLPECRDETCTNYYKRPKTTGYACKLGSEM